MGLREVELSGAGAGGADAADLGGRPRHGLGDQPDAAAVRQVGADQARRRGLLRGDRRLHAAAPVRAAGQPGALPDRQARATASSSATSSSACRRAIDSFETQTSDEEDRTYLTVATPKGYLALAQFGVVEFHTWGCQLETLEQADRIVLRPRSRRGHHVARGGRGGGARARQSWPRSGSSAFAKTTGGKGVHVVVPMTPKLDWKAVHAATGEIAARDRRDGAGHLHHGDGRGRTASERIFIDFHRNARSATAVAPYSLRARNNLPASAPLSWEDLEKIDAPEDLNYSSLPGLVAATGDPWAEIDSVRTRPAGAEARQGVSAGGETTWRRGPPGRAT